MTQEEAIKILRDVHDKALFSVRNALETIIPELAESEDERIRKQILDCFGTMRRQGCFPSKHKEQYDSWISWLEKQKEQKPILKFKVGDKIHLIDGTSPNYEDDCITIREIDTINYIGEFKEGYVPIKEQDKWELVKEQKPAEWSEEDEKRIKQLIYDTEAIRAGYEKKKEQLGERFNETLIKDCDEQIAWLKSLRPSWKPSEDEERLINTSISFLKDFADKGYENAVECIDWLKSKLNGNSGK